MHVHAVLSTSSNYCAFLRSGLCKMLHTAIYYRFWYSTTWYYKLAICYMPLFTPRCLYALPAHRYKSAMQRTQLLSIYPSIYLSSLYVCMYACMYVCVRGQIEIDFFGEREQCEIMTVKQFLGESPNRSDEDEEPWTTDLLPSVEDVARTLRQVPKGKAAGLDGLPSDLMPACLEQLATLIHPLHVKSLLSGSQPVQ